jgi:hypothetical protein
MTSSSDITTTIILLFIGLSIGQIAILGRERHQEAKRAVEELDRLELVAARIASDASILPLVDLVERQITDAMQLASCRFGLERPDLPQLLPDGRVAVTTHVFVEHDFTLPSEGVALGVVGNGAIVGWLRLTPGCMVGVPLETRVSRSRSHSSSEPPWRVPDSSTRCSCVTPGASRAEAAPPGGVGTRVRHRDQLPAGVPRADPGASSSPIRPSPGTSSPSRAWGTASRLSPRAARRPACVCASGTRGTAG